MLDLQNLLYAMPQHRSQNNVRHTHTRSIWYSISVRQRKKKTKKSLEAGWKAKEFIFKWLIFFCYLKMKKNDHSPENMSKFVSLEALLYFFFSLYEFRF